MHSLSLDGAWTVTALGSAARSPIPPEVTASSFPGAVPGVVHTDLVAAGLIADPFDGDHEASQQWIGDTDWRYERTFTWVEPGGPAAPAERVELVAHGLDTVAEIRLNGRHVGHVENQFRTHRIDVRELLVEGENTITVDFTAPVPEAERRSRATGGELPHVNHHPYNALRKSASNFGWDWGIDVATVGIWKPIAIEAWSGVRILGVRPLVDVTGRTGILTTHVDLARGDEGRGEPVEATVIVSLAGVEAARGSARVASSGVVVVAVPDVRRWWPLGFGEQPLYEVRLEVATTSGQTDAWTGRVGFRTVELDTSADEVGSRFVLRLNGRDVRVRGANWIPDHAFVTEVDRDRIDRRIADAVEANLNLLRVWGGGLYESDDFYDACDEAGILVWQDVLFACAAYAEEKWLRSEVEAELRDNATRLSPHPSLVLWNGNNENLVGYAEWGWRARLGGRTWGNGYYRRILPELLGELDPTRPYTPGSPFSFSDYLHPNDASNGTVHIWDVWNERDYTAYREWRPRFVAEFGFQGPPAWSTLTSVVHDQPLDPYGPQLLVHQKADDGNGKLERGLGPHLPVPAVVDGRGIEDWHWATQLNQAHAVQFGLEHFRSLAPLNTGAIVWQLNDDWPVVSWAAVDFAEHRKPLWHAMRAAFRPRLVTIQPDQSGADASDASSRLVAVFLNETDAAWSGEVRAERISFDGDVRAAHLATVDIDAWGVARLPLPESVTATGDPAGEVLVVTPADGYDRALWNFAEVVDQRLDPDAVELVADGASIVATARSYVRDLTLLVDKVDAAWHVDAGLVTLLPGEPATFTVTARSHTSEQPAPVDAARVLDARVVRSANEFGRAVRRA
ncbi:glycoside hydrolase family 2 protein [Agromyces larvae]|uniref:beta-mannosidase n=1 Tax=Agromyces larvae TaxID=2929802 RepID=A0ABY4BV03_9MICO|nr:glycoside hydrolase family 2 protein [Agromyces larvae]UOE43041.1 glycoside hydrolase family 2 protein [Agromyces larvae]